MSATLATDMGQVLRAPVGERDAVLVYENPGYAHGDGIRMEIVGETLRVRVRLDGVEASAWCQIMEVLEAIGTHARKTGS
jgi:hypothetical protein